MRHPLVFVSICLTTVLLASGGCPFGFCGDDYFCDDGYPGVPLVGPSVVGCGPGFYDCDVYYDGYVDPAFGDWNWGYGDWSWGFGDVYGGFPGIW